MSRNCAWGFRRVVEGEQEGCAATSLGVRGPAMTATVDTIPTASSEAAALAIADAVVRMENSLIATAAATATFAAKPVPEERLVE